MLIIPVRKSFRCNNLAENQQHKHDISVIVPLLDEEESIAELYQQIDQALQKTYTFEVVFIDDGSSDRSWEEIQNLHNANENVQGISFRRNYGKSIALQKGIDIAKGAYIVTIDADLQDDPAEIPGMIKKLEEGYDLVSGWKQKRKDPISKTIPSKFFNYVTSLATGIRLHDFNCGLKAYRSEVIRDIRLYGELHRYIPMLVHEQGYSHIAEIQVNHRERKHGKSKFGLSRFIKGFLDLLTLLFLSTYVRRPMHFFGSIGTIFLIVGGGIVIYLTIMRLFFEVYLTDRPMLWFGILFLLLGGQFFSIGFLGEMWTQSQNREAADHVNIRSRL